MQFYSDATLYFAVLPRDFFVGHLTKFCFDFRHLRHYFTINLQNVGTIAFDLDGNLLVPDLGVSVYSSKNGFLLNKIGWGYNRTVCCVDKNGRIYTAGLSDIRTYRPSGAILDLGTAHFGLAVDENRLYVCTLKGLMIVDTTTNRVIGNIGGQWPTTAVAINPHTKQVIVSQQGVMCVFESDGAFVRAIGNLKYPRQIAIDMHDNIYVVDESDACHVFSSSGQTLGELPHKFRNTWGVAIFQTTLAVSDESGIHLFQ